MKQPLVILLVLSLIGCTFDEPRDFDPGCRLMFQPGMYMQVSHQEVEEFPTSESFGVRAWALPDGQSWSEGSREATEYLPLSEAKSREVLISDTTLRETVKDTLWMIGEETSWPSKYQSLTFLAYAPFSANCECDATAGIQYSTDMLENQTDLLYTAPHSDKQKIKDGWVVQLRFEHALCLVKFRVKHRVEESEQITIRRISIDEVRHKGSFRSLPSPQWSLDASLTPLTFFEGEERADALPQPIGNYWLMLPQQLETRVTVEYDYTTAAQTGITQRLQTVPLRTNLQAGRSYTYTLSVGIDDVKFLEEIIEHRFNNKE
ncbi:MAG: fimbrillin family protein [Bacteroides sp.]|nr:fimbrillin family protein [Bacteroides sp.]